MVSGLGTLPTTLVRLLQISWSNLLPTNAIEQTEPDVGETLRLPVQQSGASPDDLRAIDRQLRDVRFNPDRLLAQNQTSEGRSDFQRWIDEKRNWIETPLTFENGSKRHQAIERCNLALQPFVEEAAASLRIERRVIAEKVAASRVLTDRDYAFCLFPEPLLREFVLDRVARAM